MKDLVTVLVVDDDAGDRQQIRHALFESGLEYEFTGVANLAEATRACEGDGFDFVFLDYLMPGGDGLSGITALRARWPDMGVIMSTGQGDEAVAVEALKRGAVDYIQKGQITGLSIRHVIENALEKAALQRKVDSQRKELETFARALAHDMKVPVGSIVTLARFVEEDIRAGKLDDAITNSQLLAQAASRSRALVDAVYEFTRLEAKFELKPVWMQHILDETLGDLKENIEQRSAQVTCGEMPVVDGDGRLMALLWQNLIGNAIKFCTAAVPTVQVAAVPHEDGWLFSVNDNGIGIPEKHRKSIFTQFGRLHSADEYEGSGLGLATCKKVVERHGGLIWCESVVGVGTTFYFTLAAAD